MVTSPEVPSITSRPRRRWFRYSLRTGLLLTTVVAVTLGLGFSRAERQKHAVEGILALGGSVVYDWQIPVQGATKPSGPAWIRALIGPHWFDHVVELRLLHRLPHDPHRIKKFLTHASQLPRVRSLSLWSDVVDSDEGRLIAQLASLEQLDLLNITLSPETARELARAPQLHSLNLGNALVSPQSLKQLMALPELSKFQLSCRSTELRTARDPAEFRLNDDGLRAVARNRRLRTLRLYNTIVTDDGVDALRDLDSLEELTISSPNVTGKSLETVTSLDRLTSLSAWQWPLEREELVTLQKMPQLRSLGLRTSLGDDCIPVIVELKHLETLVLDSPDITDAALPPLHALKNLRWLNLSDTGVDKLGLAAHDLQNALPGCTISLPKTEAEKKREAMVRRQ